MIETKKSSRVYGMHIIIIITSIL